MARALLSVLMPVAGTPRSKDGDLMRFYALQLVCSKCSTRFLVGGSARNDLTRWRTSVVECRHCGADTPAAAGQEFDLRSLSTQGDVESPVGDACHA
jgi:DNA-directed RNA polymerase subunit RPC12/RpoP